MNTQMENGQSMTTTSGELRESKVFNLWRQTSGWLEKHVNLRVSSHAAHSFDSFRWTHATPCILLSEIFISCRKIRKKNTCLLKSNYFTHNVFCTLKQFPLKVSSVFWTTPSSFFFVYVTPWDVAQTLWHRTYDVFAFILHGGAVRALGCRWEEANQKKGRLGRRRVKWNLCWLVSHMAGVDVLKLRGSCLDVYVLLCETPRLLARGYVRHKRAR